MPNETKEYYMSVLLDRATSRNVIVYSTEGGMDIEEVAEHHPDKIQKECIDPRVGLRPFQCNKIATNLGLTGAAKKEMVKFVASLYKAYEGCDAAMFEINPVLKTSDEKIDRGGCQSALGWQRIVPPPGLRGNARQDRRGSDRSGSR